MKKILFFMIEFIILFVIYFCLICVDPLNIILYSIIFILIFGVSIFGYLISILMRTSGISNVEKTLELIEKNKLSEKKFREIICKLLYSMGFENIEKSKDTLANFVCDNTYFLVRLGDLDDETILKAEKEKENLLAQTYIIISFGNMREDFESGLTYWNKPRIIANLRNLLPHQTNFQPTMKVEKLTIGDLDFATQDEFENECNKLLKNFYIFIRKENEFYIYNIESKEYGVLFVRAGKEKLSQGNMEEIFGKIYSEGYSNALVVTNGYFSDGIQEMSAKLRIDLWNRDNLIFMINR